MRPVDRDEVEARWPSCACWLTETHPRQFERRHQRAWRGRRGERLLARELAASDQRLVKDLLERWTAGFGPDDEQWVTTGGGANLEVETHPDGAVSLRAIPAMARRTETRVLPTGWPRASFIKAGCAMLAGARHRDAMAEEDYRSSSRWS